MEMIWVAAVLYLSITSSYLIDVDHTATDLSLYEYLQLQTVA
ncbi:hypothetical protein ACG91D_21785 [Acinetobacter guillouiae]